MNVTHWLRSVFAPRTTRKRSPAHRLCVEPLEDRTTPSSGGLLDPTFGSGGVVTSSFSSYLDRARDVLVQPDGKIVTAGYTESPSSRTWKDFLVARYNPDGTLDGGFGTGGRAITDISRDSNWVNAVALQPGTGGKILVAGQTGDIGGDFALARYTANGILDTSFGKRGITLTDMAGQPGDFADAIAVQPDGKIVVAGLANTAPNGAVAYYFALARYTANGALDTTFGSGGKVITSLRASGGPHLDYHAVAVTLQGDGKIVLAGGTYIQPAADFVVARFNPNGTPDAAFGSGGRVLTDIAGGADQASGVAIQPDGKIVAVGRTFVAGTNEVRFAAARYNPDGILDGGFGQGGTVTTQSGDGTDGFLNDVAVQADGKILAGGWTRTGVAPSGGVAPGNMVLVRYNPDGSPDTTYGSAGTGVVMTLIGTDARASALVLQADGKAILAGISGANGVASLALARYLPSAPQVGSFTADPVTAGASVTLTASGTTDGNSGAAVTQVTFYADSNGDGILQPGTDILLGYGTQTGPGTWTFSFSTAGRAAGSYTLFAQAEDSYGVFGDPFAITLDVV
jgi:uncharacterized delta-60 repeat protein